MSICSMCTHLRGVIIPVKLAHSYMIGPNQESLYLDAARVTCSTICHEHIRALREHAIDQILIWNQDRKFKAFKFRLFTVLLILLINVNDASTLATLQQVFRRGRWMWECPPLVNRAGLEYVYTCCA